MSLCDYVKLHYVWPPDKHESKLKGVIYFQAIEEVYYDHLRSATKVGPASCSVTIHPAVSFKSLEKLQIFTHYVL